MRHSMIIPGFLLAMGWILLPGPAQAQEDTRWLPWLGCWEPAGERVEEGAEILVCIEPAAQGVEISTLADGEVMGVERILADGIPQPAAEGGCEGTREARWSGDHRRVFVLSDLRCAEGVHRTTAGVFAIAGDGELWTEIHAVRSADRDPVLAVRSFAPAASATLARHERDPAPGLEGRELAIRTSRIAASGRLDPADILEAVEVAGPELASVLVLEMGHPFELDAGTLRALSRQGVPADVLDMMVAVTWPERFQVEAGRAELDGRTAARPDDRRAAPWPGPAVAWSYGACGGLRSRFCFDPFYSSVYGFGYPYWGSYWGPGFFSGPVRYVVVTPPSVRDRSRVSPDGYTSVGGTGRQARPARGGAPQPSPSAQPSSRPTRNDSPSASSGPSRVSPSGGHSSGGSGDRRPARPRGGGGGG